MEFYVAGELWLKKQTAVICDHGTWYVCLRGIGLTRDLGRTSVHGRSLYLIFPLTSNC